MNEMDQADAPSMSLCLTRCHCPASLTQRIPVCFNPAALGLPEEISPLYIASNAPRGSEA